MRLLAAILSLCSLRYALRFAVIVERFFASYSLVYFTLLVRNSSFVYGDFRRPSTAHSLLQ